MVMIYIDEIMIQKHTLPTQKAAVLRVFLTLPTIKPPK